MDSLIGILQTVLVIVLSLAPFVILVAGVLTLRRRRSALGRPARVFSRASAFGVYPHSLRPPPDLQLEYEDTPIFDEMPPDDLARLRDTGAIELPADRR